MSYSHLTTEDRVVIQTLIKEGLSHRQIAGRIGFSHSTVSAEIRRNCNEHGNYRWREARKLTEARRKTANQRFRVLSTNEKLPNNNVSLTRYVVRKLKENWSPEQIAGRLREFKGIRIAVQTIYDWIYLFRKDLRVHLHHIRGGYRKSRQALLNQRERSKKQQDERSIDNRPAHVENRSRIGHFEGDTIVGASHSGRIITIAERKCGFLMAKRMANEPQCIRSLPIEEQEILRKTPALKFADYASRLFNENIKPKHKKTLTLDNGTEMAGFEWIERQTACADNPDGIRVYFAHAYHSWERGTNENTNGLLRFYFPKKMSFANITDEMVDKAVNEINNRPRKRLGYRTPAEVMKQNGVLVRAGM